jgi:aspartyl-tRNA synthetase
MRVDDWPKGREGVNSADRQVPRRRHAAALLQQTGRIGGDLVFFGAGPWKSVCDFMGALR